MKAIKKNQQKKTLLFGIRVKSRLKVKDIEPQEDRLTQYKAICTFEKKDLTDWTDETTADATASHHRNQYHHPVNVLELH